MRWSIEELMEQKRLLLRKSPEIASFFVSIDDGIGQMIPFLPIGAFRKFHIFNKSAAHKTFFSSGSTNEVRARHSFSKEGIELYKRNTSENFRAFLKSLNMALDATILSLVPQTSEWPQSSLAAMIEMFKEEGLNVVYDDGEISGDEVSEFVIFGTSFHHLLLHQQPNFKQLQELVQNKRVTVIDTGGTKGRTRNYSLEEVRAMIQRTYRRASSCQVVSEYGMCELSSQAWSLNAPHDGWFKTSNTLTPVIIDLDKRCVIRESGHLGFLGFIDRGNQDSFMAIITEDLAMMNQNAPDCFMLVGRAPDASVKGCSLNVKENFQSTAEEAIFCPPLKKGVGGFLFNASLLGDVWDMPSKTDLLHALASISESGIKFEKTRVGQRVLMILSANIPITFLFPAVAFLKRGVSELHIQLPSIRQSDARSERVRQQISVLLEEITPFFDEMDLYLHTDKDVPLSSLREFDAVLVFGSDDTIHTFRAALPVEGKTELIGLGSVLNAHILNAEDEPAALANKCSQWMGRGCLTPVALVGDNPKEGFFRGFANEFENHFSKRLGESGHSQPFAHRHLLLDVEGMLKSLGRRPEDHILRGENTIVIDLRALEPGQVSMSQFPFDRAGCGLIFFMTQFQFDKVGSMTSYPSDPKFSDPHMDKTWAEWIE